MDVDHYVFVGDYVDSYDLDDRTIRINLEEVIKFKKDNPQEVTLLIGNHDIHYMFFPHFQSTGFRPQMLSVLRSLFNDNIGLFQAAFTKGNYLFTHAGVSKSWLEDNVDTFEDINDLASKLNSMLSHEKGRQLLALASVYRGGFAEFGGPFWCDFFKELLVNPASNINQIVGHTRGKFLVRENVAGNDLINVNYIAYSDEPIFTITL